MKIQLIDESQFRQIKGIRQIIVHNHARKFASLDLKPEKISVALPLSSNIVQILTSTKEPETLMASRSILSFWRCLLGKIWNYSSSS